MRVTIHISHTESDDLASVQAAAAVLGFEITERGGFMGDHHTELAKEMNPTALEDLLDAYGENLAVAV